MNNIGKVKEIVRRLGNQSDLESIDDLVLENIKIKSLIKIGQDFVYLILC